MDWIEGAIAALKRANGELVAPLPDTNLALLIEAAGADDAPWTVLVSREEDAVGVLAGVWLGSEPRSNGWRARVLRPVSRSMRRIGGVRRKR